MPIIIMFGSFLPSLWSSSNQGRKITALVLGWVEDSALRSEASELSDHSRGALLLGLFGDGWASFFVTDALVQEQPD